FLFSAQVLQYPRLDAGALHRFASGGDDRKHRLYHSTFSFASLESTRVYFDDTALFSVGGR
ncbi:MAG: hypothetical protein ABSF68_18070, partial [Candidatus Acidiferrales bacterium]